MPLSPNIIQRLAALHLPADAISEVLAIVAEVAEGTPRRRLPVAAKEKGTRIGDFAPDIETIVSMGLPRKTAEAEARKFVDYFRAAPSGKGIKLDWPATWRNWARRAMEQLGIPENTSAGNEAMIDHSNIRWEFLVCRWERENGTKFPRLAEKWPFPESWLRDANEPMLQHMAL